MRHGTAKTVLVEASEEGWVKLMSKSLYASAGVRGLRFGGQRGVLAALPRLCEGVAKVVEAENDDQGPGDCGGGVQEGVGEGQASVSESPTLYEGRWSGEAQLYT